MDVEIEAMQPTDWPAVASIYCAGIATGDATFDHCPPGDWDSWSAGKLSRCRLVLRCEGGVRGWAALSTVSSRPCYRGVAEVSLYLADGYRGLGLGTQLLQALVDCAEQRGLWTLQAGVFPENVASIALHRKLGFRVVGIREKIARMDYGRHQGRWRDVVLLERRIAISDRN